jgi:hypothetical protein
MMPLLQILRGVVDLPSTAAIELSLPWLFKPTTPVASAFLLENSTL